MLTTVAIAGAAIRASNRTISVINVVIRRTDLPFFARNHAHLLSLRYLQKRA